MAKDEMKEDQNEDLKWKQEKLLEELRAVKAISDA